MEYKRSFAKSEIPVIGAGPVAAKLALYPNESILAVCISGSHGNHCCGQKYCRSRPLAQVARLVPPKPWTNMMSNGGDMSGS